MVEKLDNCCYIMAREPINRNQFMMIETNLLTSTMQTWEAAGKVYILQKIANILIIIAIQISD